MKRRMRFEEAYEGWQGDRLTQEAVARLLGVHERTFRRHIDRYEEAGLDGLIDKRLSQLSQRRAPVDEVLRLTERYPQYHRGWNARHFYAWYRKDGGGRGYTWVKGHLQEAGSIERGKKRSAHRKKQERAHWPDMMIHRDGSTKEVYLPAFNAAFMQAACEEGSVFVAWIGGGLDDYLCERHERVGQARTTV